MSSDTEKSEDVHDVTGRIFDRFLAKLGEADIPPDVVDRLTNVLKADQKPTERAVADALFPEDQQP